MGCGVIISSVTQEQYQRNTFCQVSSDTSQSGKGLWHEMGALSLAILWGRGTRVFMRTQWQAASLASIWRIWPAPGGAPKPLLET
jgi:hypothetical protein